MGKTPRGYTRNSRSGLVAPAPGGYERDNHATVGAGTLPMLWRCEKVAWCARYAGHKNRHYKNGPAIGMPRREPCG